jgi:hypothetical protein
MVEVVDLSLQSLDGGFFNCWFNFNGHLKWTIAGDRTTAVDYLEMCTMRLRKPIVSNGLSRQRNCILI